MISLILNIVHSEYIVPMHNQVKHVQQIGILCTFASTQILWELSKCSGNYEITCTRREPMECCELIAYSDF